MPGHRTKGFCASAAALALCAVLAGCGGSGDATGGGKIVLRYTWWGNPDRAARTEQAVALFEKQHPGVRVQTSFSGYDAYKQKLAIQATGGDAPDVMQLDYRQIDQYASGHVLLDLGKVKSALRTGEIDAGLLATGRVDGTLYAVPQGRGTETLVYDVATWKASGVPLPKRGWTWSEWADAMRALARRTGKPGATDPGQSEDAFEVWLRGRGKSLYTKSGSLGFTASDLTRWWAFADRLRREGTVSKAEQTTQLDGTVENTPLGRGTASSDFNWDAPASGYLAIVKGGVALAPMPSGADGTPGQYYKPSMFLGVAADTSHPKESAELVDFLLNDPQAAKILGATRGIPVNETIRKQTASQLKDFDKTVADYQASLEGTLKDPPQAPPSGDNALQTTFARDYDQVSYERMSPREAAENYVTEAKAELRS
ncbi:ABC transporter substrate-binding protein [Streptomyces spinosirectus]|uniref:ABC transporter substrate-binding protein n=1 Tax=Streptomyces TaxID=1883 RepID=UPI001C9DCEBB|nr:MULTISPECIES: ABC transporter substrate-binding protein [Streptomyces]MBY8341498.1 carbohydrate ABC transporter substrate-binding protein [Streptomyces plumbidurans]UIR16214.1 ABC transporter substrate-binding protein [Streptomyces spinosirectus]